ncbi:MAG: hypothetical protein K8T90_08635 [Planctomycetes bacterium]|nr:hypothetical protein [Planctomycetota bacterium]
MKRARRSWMSSPALTLVGVVVTAIGLVSALVSTLPARADDGPPAASADDDSGGAADPGPWEEVVFLPESGLSVLLERDPRGALLDRATYLDLYRRARAARGGASEGLPGPAARLVRCEAEGVVAGDQARIRMKLSVTSRGAGREVLPLHLGGSVTSATLDGAAATLGADAKGNLTLAVRGDGPHEAVIEVVAPVVRTKGARSVRIDLPAAAAAKWTLEIPGRVTASAGEGLWRAERLSAPDRTRLVAFGATSALIATWHEGDQGTDLPPMVRAQFRTLAEVGERSLDAVVLLRIECWRSPRDAFDVTLPADVTVVGVDGEGASLVPQDAAKSDPDRAAYTLKFAEPFTGVRTVVMRTSRTLSGAGTSNLPVADMRNAETVDRVLAVRFKDGLRGFVEPGSGATRLDPALSEDGAVDALLRLDTVSADATPRARSERPSVLVRADVRALLDLADDGPWLAASFLYLPRGDRLYGVDPLLPSGFLPETVTVSGDRAFLRGTTSDGRLSLVFPGGVAPGGAVTVVVRGRWPVAGWSVEDAVERTAPLPRLDAGSTVNAAGSGSETAIDVEGWLGVVVPPGNEAREEDTTGLVPVAVSELRDRAGYTAEGLALGWRFRGSAPGGRLRVTRPAASVTGAVALLVTPSEDHLTLEGSAVVTVQRSGIREVRLAVVPALGDLLRIDCPDVAEKRRTTVDGHDVWIVRFGRLVRDGTMLRLAAELPLKDGAAAVPAISVEGTTRFEMMVGVAAGGELDVKTESTGLRSADPADLAPVFGSRAVGLLRAWKGERDATATLTVRVVRLAASPLPSAFADSVTLTTVLGMDGIARTRLDARVRNADRQALDVTLPAGARLSSARVAGEAVRPVRTSAGVLLVPIVPSAEPFDVAIIYEEAVNAGANAASLQAPDLGVPGSRAIWTVYFPEGSIPVDASGEFSMRVARPGVPMCLRLLADMAGGVTMGAFPEDGDVTFGKGVAGPAPRVDLANGATPEMEEPQSVPDPATPLLAETLAAPTVTPPPQERIAARAAQRGLFGMDIRLLAAGPSMTTTRLGPTGGLDVRWRSAAGAATVKVLIALAAFIAALFARRRGVGAPTWTVLALALFTAGPIVLGAVDTGPWDAAAAATLLYALLAFVQVVVRGVVGRAARFAPRRTAAAVALAVVVLSAGAARAADKVPPEPVSPGRVYVPYDPKRPETLRSPERVFLPYARYRALWNDAHPEDLIESATPPVVVSATYEGRVDGRTFLVTAKYEIDPVDGGVVALPPGASVEGATLDGRPASAMSSAAGGATLVSVPRGATAAARTVLQATLRWAVAGDLPGGVLRTPIPRAPRTSLVLDVPVADAVVTLASAGGWSTSPEGGGTRVVANLGPIDTLDVAWQPRGADAAGGLTRFEIDTEATARLRPGLLEWSADVVLRVLAGTVQEFDAVLPAGLEMRSVGGAAVASWTVVDRGTLRVRLLGAGPGESKIALTGLVHLAGGGDSVVVPEFLVRGAAVDRSRVSVSAEEGRLAVIETAGVERTDNAAGAQPGVLTFRRVRAPSRLVVRVEAVAADLTVASRQHLHLGSEASRLRAEFDFAPGPRGLFEAGVAVPAGWSLDEAIGATSFAEPGSVRLVFKGAPREARSVTLRLRGPVAGGEALPFPVLRVVGATRETADLLVSTSPGFAAAAVGATGLESVPAEQFAGWPALDVAESRTLAWHDARGDGAVSIRRDVLQPIVRPTVVADLTVLDDRVIVDALVEWDVRGGGERVFRVDAPPGVTDAWVLGDGLREVRREMVGDRQRLTVTMQAAATGSVSFRVLYDLAVPADGSIVVAGPEPVGGEGARAFLLLRALGESEVQIAAAPGLETCDVSDLPLIPQGLDPLRVLRFLRARDTAWRLPLRLVAHQLGDLPEARIHLVDATTVADRDGSSRTRVTVRLFNRARSFLPVKLPADADLESVLVGGAPVRPVTRPAEPGVVQVPVRVQSLGEESQVVSLTFRSAATAPGARFSTLEPRLPEFPGVPVDATTWRLVLPEDRNYSFSGNMDSIEEMEVAISRAEAYASDVSRLRTVLEKGSRQQQIVAAQNLVENTRELQESLDLAQSRMADLERAASEGRVDRARLAEGRRKAKDLASEIEQALGDVRRNTGPGTVRGDDVNLDPTGALTNIDDMNEAQKQSDDHARYATKEAQSEKTWLSNRVIPPNSAPSKPGAPPQAGQSPGGARSKSRFVAEGPQTAGGDRGGDGSEVDVALVTHGSFDAFVVSGDKLKSVYRRDGLESDLVRSMGWGPSSNALFGAARPGSDPGQEGTAGSWGSDPTAAGAARPLVQAAGRDFSGYFGGGGGGGGARLGGNGGGPGGGRATPAPSVQGLISLAPPLVEQGRAYAFRKLDSAAVVTISTRTPGTGRRIAAGLAFLGLFAAVWALRRRRARRLTA